MNIDKAQISQNFNTISGTDKGRAPLENESKAPEVPGDQISLNSGGAPSREKKELTVLFYMHGQYKDLHKSTASTFFQLEQAGSNEQVNIVAQLGRAVQDDPSKDPQNVDGDWSGVRRYYVTKQDHSDISMTKEQWIEVEQKVPNNPVVHYVLGDVYWGEGDKEKALAEYAKAKELGILDYMKNYEAPESKKIRDELDGITKPYEDAYKDKQVFGSKPVQTLSSDVKMGDPAVLKDFVAWGMKNYPANHYVLVVTGHGGAWIGALEMPPAVMDKAIREGVEQASKDTGEQKKLDDFIFNSCYMGNMESAYEMKGTADINISSENYSRGNMLYDWSDHITNMQKAIQEKGEFDPRAFAKDFVEYYRKEGKEVRENFPEFMRWKESYLTLTAIDNKNIDKVVTGWKDFVEAVKANNVPDHVIFGEFAKSQGFNSDAFNPAQTIFAFYDMIKDIGDIMKRVQENPAIPKEVKEQATRVQGAIKEAIIAEQHEGKDMENATGLTAWTPTNAVDIAFMAQRYEKEDVPAFAEKSGGYPAFLRDAAKRSDPEALKEFMGDIQIIRNINKVLADPANGLADQEKKILEDAKDVITKQALAVKERLDLTIPKARTLFKLGEAFKREPDFAKYGNIARDITGDLAQKDGLTDKRI